MKERKNILVIEDQKCIRTLLNYVLGKQYEVTAMDNGLSGMAWLHSGNFPDLILLDMNMPEIDGLKFLGTIKRSGFFKHIPVMVLSGNEDETDKAFCFEKGVKEYIHKPFNPIDLKNKINTLLNN